MGGLLLPNGKQAFTDSNSRPLAGGKVAFFAPGTQTPRDTWQDAALTILNTNPVVLDARGEASIYGLGAYRQVLRDASNVLIWDQIIPDALGVVNDAINNFFLSNLTVTKTIAAVRALDSSTRKNAFATGYLAQGDLGGGMYYVDPLDTTTPDNNGSVLVGADGARWKLKTLGGVVCPEQFGAFSIESGSPTARADANFAAIIASGYRLEGNNKTYYVAQVFPDSNTDWRRVRFESVGWVGAVGAMSNQSVITVDGTTSAKRNFYFEDVWVNGRRDLFTNITLTGGEDGKLHAWRFVGDVQNVYGIRCKGINAGSAGLVMHNPTPSATVVQYLLQNFKFVDSTFSGNREHGVFGDSVKFISLIRCDLTKNGIDIDPLQPISSGLRGATVLSGGVDKYFGGPIDIEGYAVGSGVNQILLEDCDCRGCAVGALFVDITPSNTTGFVTRSEITIRGGDYDLGSATVFLNPNGKHPLIFEGNFVSGPKPYSLVLIDGARMSGYPWFRGISKLTMTGGFVNAANFCAFVFNCEYISITAPCLNNTIDFGGQPTPANITAAYVSGSGGALTASQSFVGCLSNGAMQQLYIGTILSVTNPAVALKYKYSAPTGYQVVAASPTSRGTSIATGVFYEIINGEAIVWFTPPDDKLEFRIIFTVAPKLTA